MPVQVLPANPTKRPSFLESIATGMGPAIQPAVQGYFDTKKQQALQGQQNEALKKAGFGDLIGLPEKAQTAAIAERLKGSEKRKTKESEYQQIIKMMNERKSQASQLSGENSIVNENEPTRSEYTPEEKALMATVNPAVERAISHGEDVERRETTEAKKLKQTEFQKDREYNTQFSKPFVDQATKTLQAVPIRKGLVSQWKRDIASGEASGLGQYLVDRTGLEFWRSPEAARSKTAAKEYFVEGLSSLSPGTRPNMFIEQQLASALPLIGRDVESNLSVLEVQNFVDDLKEQYARNIVKLAEEDNEKYGYERKDIGARAQKMLDEYAPERQKKLALDIREIHEDQLDDKQLSKELFLKGKVSPGTPLTQRVRAILMLKNDDNVDKAMREALKLGYELE